MPTIVSMDHVREEERKDILERRTITGLETDSSSQDTARKDLVGVAFSGGGQRSACFSLGVVQALFKSGVWRFVDYLSTVSGGGYLGGYISSLVLKEQQPQTPQTSPLMAHDRQPQSADV